MLVIKNMEIVDKLEVKVKHKEYVISEGAMEANKINILEHNKQAIEEKEAAELILKFLNDNKSEEEEGYIVIGQNIGFDIKFLEAMFLRCYLIKEYRKVISYRNLDEMFKKEYKDKIVQGIAKMYGTLGHEKFHTVIKITMDAVDIKKEKGKDVNFTELKEILEGAMKIADVIYGKQKR